MNDASLAPHSLADVGVSVPGRADVSVGTANEEANEGDVHDSPLATHSLADEHVSVPGADVGVSVPRADEDVGVPGGYFSSLISLQRVDLVFCEVTYRSQTIKRGC